MRAPQDGFAAAAAAAAVLLVVVFAHSFISDSEGWS
jgi:hypothetical protein